MIRSLLQTYKRTTIVNSFAMACSLGLFVFTIIYWWNAALAYSLAIATTAISLILALRTKHFLKISVDDFLEHINRRFPDYQESAQLLAKESKLNDLQRIQKEKIKRLFKDDLNKGRLKNLQPQLTIVLPIILIAFSVINLSLMDDLYDIYDRYVRTNIDDQSSPSLAQQSNPNLSPPTIVNHRISIVSPSYTGNPAQIADQLDFEAVQGSSINGLIEFSRPELQYYYSRSGKPVAKMIKKDAGFTFSDIAAQTSLYKFSYKAKDELVEIDGIYTISMIRDNAAKITITKPRTTLLEFSKSEQPRFTLSAKIKDDFGVNDVRILASVAKGSGEAVKFRDKTFRFEASEISPKENLSIGASGYFLEAEYQKSWSLSELQMEPGDEAYFSLQVLDNKQPNNQLSKSNSIIVRWLDEDEIELGLEGIQIRFIPEYFRSQRQIIIETEQLIADGKDISREKFDELSIDLGRSQSDLKQKYGQYLGDEFGEGQGAQLGLADGYHGGETMSSGEASAGLNHEGEDNPKDEPHDDSHQHEEAVNSEHQTHDHQGHDTGTEDSRDLSGAQQLIDQFGHNHSSVEVAPLSQKDPKSWMKMAVNEMWQAELHLMMSQPAKALPYEYQAYKFLKLARQAERVYAKRLGFEPPPVSEERRLTGELKAILEYDLWQVKAPKDNLDVKLFTTNYHLLNQKRILDNSQLTEQQQRSLTKLSQKLLGMSEDRPALIKYAAIAEKLSAAKSLALNNCRTCVSDLKAKLWQLIPVPLSRPMLRQKSTSINSQEQKFYLEENGVSQ